MSLKYIYMGLQLSSRIQIVQSKRNPVKSKIFMNNIKELISGALSLSLSRD